MNAAIQSGTQAEGKPLRLQVLLRLTLPLLMVLTGITFWIHSEMNVLTGLADGSEGAQERLKNELNSFTIWLTFVMMISAGVMTGLVMLLTSSILKPLESLHSALEVVTSDESGVNARLKPFGPKEVQAVTLSFNRFMEKLGQSVDSIILVATDLTSSSKQLENTGHTLNEQATSQSREMEQVSLAANQLTGSFEEVAHNAQKASDESVLVKQQAEKGHTALVENQKQITALSERISNAAIDLQQLHKSSEQIGDVLNSITDIAEQTNLLALNAAIEAARAGEHGRGFAVVADEVRTLSEQTRNSTEKTQSVIQELRVLIEKGISAMDEGAREAAEAVDRSRLAEVALTDILTAVNQLERMNTQIAHATETQQSTMEEVNHNIHHLAEAVAVLQTETVQISQQSASMADAGQQMEQVARAI